MEMKSMHMDCRLLLAIAKSAAAACGSNALRSPYPEQSLIAIVFSAAALEAFVNEAGELAAKTSDSAAGVVDDEQLKLFGSLMRELEEARSPPSLKFMLAAHVLTGDTGKGRKDHENLELLFELRNAIMHAKPGNRGGLLRRMGDKTADGDTGNLSWVYQAATRATAEWAAEVAEGTIERISGAFKNGLFGVMLQRMRGEGSVKVFIQRLTHSAGELG